MLGALHLVWGAGPPPQGPHYARQVGPCGWGCGGHALTPGELWTHPLGLVSRGGHHPQEAEGLWGWAAQL